MFITQIKVMNGSDAEIVSAKSTDSIQAVLDKSGVHFSANALVQANGAFIARGALSTTTVEDIVNDPEATQLITTEIKSQNAADPEACAVINGSAMVITSTATPEQIKIMKKYRPNALKLYEGEGANKKLIFEVDIEEGPGCINRSGAVYSERTNTNGKATITLNVPDEVDDSKEWAQDKLGVAILHLRKLEKQFAPMLSEVQAEKDAVAAAISVA